MAQPARPQFHHTLTYALDQILPGTGPGDFSQFDPTHSFFREIMGFDDDKITAFRDSAEAFFRDTYGLDFTKVIADKNDVKNLPSLIMTPFRFSKDASMSVILHSNVGDLSSHNRIRDGGYLAMVTGTGVAFRGTYGGSAGKPASPGEFVVIGFYNIVNLRRNSDQPEEESRPIVITYRALSPIRTTADGDMVLHCGLQHPSWGDGVGRGVQVIAPADSSHLRVMQRSVLTFPTSLV